MKKERKIQVTENGPYLVSGNIELIKETIVSDDKGNSMNWKKEKSYPLQENYSLCRCGHSKNHPYCSGEHKRINFNGEETAANKEYIKQAKKTTGKEIILTDAKRFCSNSRFCHNKIGDAWNLTEDSVNKKSKNMAIQQACNCPSGRLVAWNRKTKKAIEPKFKPTISTTEDPEAEVSGPLWVKGEVEIESCKGKKYEKRNRVTLCRCGKSSNKPFCDGTHMEVGFRDDSR